VRASLFKRGDARVQRDLLAGHRVEQRFEHGRESRRSHANELRRERLEKFVVLSQPIERGEVGGQAEHLAPERLNIPLKLRIGPLVRAHGDDEVPPGTRWLADGHPHRAIMNSEQAGVVTVSPLVDEVALPPA
jgi:hypothetical protein